MAETALQRQNKRINRLKAQGIHRSTVFVHKQCRSALDNLRPYFTDPEKMELLDFLVKQLHQKIKPTNVAQVRHLSPFRYPGGKTWLVPKVRQWLSTIKNKPEIFIEPFAGGAIVGLSVAAENLAKKVFLSELDDDVAAVWDIIFNGKKSEVETLSNQILNFEVTFENVQSILENHPTLIKDRAFRAIIKNRVRRGGYKFVSKPLVIEDATLKLRAIELAVAIGGAEKEDAIYEINEAAGTNIKYAGPQNEMVTRDGVDPENIATLEEGIEQSSDAHAPIGEGYDTTIKADDTAFKALASLRKRDMEAVDFYMKSSCGNPLDHDAIPAIRFGSQHHGDKDLNHLTKATMQVMNKAKKLNMRCDCGAC